MAPSFFKVLVDPFAHNLPLPPDFVKSYFKNKIPKDPIIQTVNGEYAWGLKIKKVGEIYCFDHGWHNVVKGVALGYGDFIVFWLVDACTFKMLVYSPDGCEKDLPPKVKVEDYGDDVIDGANDGDPMFKTTINISHEDRLLLPPTFVRLSGIDTKENIIIKGLDGNERLMALRSYQQNNFTQYCLSIGLPAFMRSNSISEGDECVFKYITSEDKMCLAKVTKSETQTMLSSPAKVVKRKRGRPAKVVKRNRGRPAKVVKRKRGRPAKVVMRKRGRPAKITMAENVKITVADVVKRKRGRPAKVVMRKRGRPAKITMAEDVKITVADVVKRKRGRPPASPRVIDDVKKKNGQQPCGHSGDLEGVDMCVEVGKRPLGRPAKRLCGNAPQHK